MIVHQVEYGKVSHDNMLTFGSEAHYLYVICRSAVHVHWQRDFIAEDGGQLFLHPGQQFTLVRKDSFLLYDLLEFSPEEVETHMIDTLPLPERFTFPAHLPELSTRVRAIYDIHFSADKYRSEKTTLLGQMLLYSIASGDPDGDFMSCDTVIDHRRSFDLQLELEFSAIAIADSGDWADDVYLLLSNSQRRASHDPQAQQIILECQALRQSTDSYILGLSCHFCHNGSWKERIFKNSAPLPFPISRMRLQYHYDASTHCYSWTATESTTGTVLHRYTVAADQLSPEAAASSAMYLYIYRNPIGINIRTLTLRYADAGVTAAEIPLQIRSDTESLSPKGQLNQKLRRLRTLISDDPSKDWTIQKAAGFVNLSESRFYYLYKQYFGLTFMNDVIRSRIKLSCFLLLTTQDPIKDISKKVGYENDSLFYRQFKDQMGISPNDYRKMNIRSI